MAAKEDSVRKRKGKPSPGNLKPHKPLHRREARIRAKVAADYRIHEICPFAYGSLAISRAISGRNGGKIHASISEVIAEWMRANGDLIDLNFPYPRMDTDAWCDLLPLVGSAGCNPVHEKRRASVLLGICLLYTSPSPRDS